MKQLINKIKNLIKIARVVLVDDSNDIRVAKVQFLGKKQRCAVFTPYGFMSNPPPNSAGPIWQVDGEESKLIGMFDLTNERTNKNLNPGETAIGNYLTGDYVLFKEGKIIEVNATGDLIATVGSNAEITAGADVTVSAGANATVSAVTQIDLTAPIINITGNVVIAGGISTTGVGGTISSSGTITAPEAIIDGVTYSDHVHNGVTAGGADTTGPKDP